MGFFSPSPPPPPPPPPSPPAADDPEIEKARRDALKAAALAAGQSDTILTGGTGAPGGANTQETILTGTNVNLGD